MRNLFGTCQEVRQYIGSPSVGYDYPDAFFCHSACNTALGKHATAAKSASLCLDVWCEVISWLHLSDEACLGIAGTAGVYPIDIAQNDEAMGIHHGSYQSGEFIVVGKHQFRHTHSIVFVDNGDHSVVEHHLHAGTLVEILLS